MSPRSEPAFIEIVERYPKNYPLPDAAVGYIKPNEVRINGIPLACPRGHAVTVHEVDLGADDVVMVTLTLFARRIVVGAEHSDEKFPQPAEGQ